MSEPEQTTDAAFQPLWCALLGLVALTWAGTTSADVVTLKNGDRLTGELKSLDRGLLSFEIDASVNDVQLEWDEVRSLTAVDNLEVRLDTGERHFGHLLDAAPEASISVAEESGTSVLPMSRVVFMTPIEDTWRERMSGDISAGYNFTQASDVAQLNFGLSAKYEGIKHVFEGTIDTLSTDSGDGDSFNRADLSLRHSRMLRDRWVVGQLAAFERNESLGIDLRSSIGGGAGRTLRQTNDRFLGLFGGAVVSQESITGSSEHESSIEGLFVVAAQWFRYDEPELDVTTRFSLFPSFSESGRVRTGLDVDFRWGIVEDLYWSFSLYRTSDNDPPTVDAATSDFGIVTSLGWKF